MNTRINDSKGFKGIQSRVQKRRNHNQEVDTPEADETEAQRAEDINAIRTQKTRNYSETQELIQD